MRPPTNRDLAVALALMLPAAAMAECKLMELLKIPVTLSGEKPLVPVRINGQEVDFVLDSGAGFNSITRSAVKRFKLETWPLPFNFNTYGIGGVTDDDSGTTVDEVAIGGIKLHRIEFIVGDDVYSGEAAGLIGQALLSAFDVDYDLAHGMIRLMHPDKACRDSVLAYWAGSEPFSAIDISGSERLPSATGSLLVRHRRPEHTIGNVKVNDRQVRAIFDSGADYSMIDTEAARRAGVTRDTVGAKPAGFTQGFGHGRVETWIGPFESFQIGDEKVTHTHLRVGDLRDIHADMLIGVDFFLSHRIYVSNLQHKLYFTFNGGHVFDLSQTHARSEAAGSVGDDPADADGYSRRGMASAARGELGAAIADLTKACELAPADAKFLALRAELHWQAGDVSAAKSDVDQALVLNPQALGARLRRAQLLIAQNHVDAALADLDQSAAGVVADSTDTLFIAGLYSEAGSPDAAVSQYTRWIGAHLEKRLMPTALNGRCRNRALAGRDLGAALEDCNKALALSRGAYEIRDSRGLVEFRLGKFEEAIEDFDAALKKKPDLAWSLYGRGLSKLRTGREADGQADLDAAKAADPKIAQEAAKFGISP